jgi:hypothetical protein
MVIRSLPSMSLGTMHDPKEPVLLIALAKDHAACYVVSFGDHVPYLRVLAPRNPYETSPKKRSPKRIQKGFSKQKRVTSLIIFLPI